MHGEMEDKCGIVGIHCKDESKNVASFVAAVQVRCIALWLKIY